MPYIILSYLFILHRLLPSFQSGICVLPDNNPDDRYRYEIAIWTGMRRNAGTESEVTIILSGDLQDSEPRRLVNPDTEGYQRGSLEKFILTTPEDIGSLYCIRIWHDNSKGSWYLSRVMVTDLEREEQYYFICDRWLAVDEDDGAVSASVIHNVKFIDIRQQLCPMTLDDVKQFKPALMVIWAHTRQVLWFRWKRFDNYFSFDLRLSVCCPLPVMKNSPSFNVFFSLEPNEI